MMNHFFGQLYFNGGLGKQRDIPPPFVKPLVLNSVYGSYTVTQVPLQEPIMIIALVEGVPANKRSIPWIKIDRSKKNANATGKWMVQQNTVDKLT